MHHMDYKKLAKVLYAIIEVLALLEMGREQQHKQEHPFPIKKD